MRRPSYRASILRGFFGLLIVAFGVSAQPETEELERRLGAAVGRERLEILVELVELSKHEAPEEAVARGAEASELLRGLPDDDLELRLSSALWAAYRDLNRYREALSHARRAQQIAREKGDKPALAIACSRLSDIHRRLDEYEQALEESREAIRLYEELGSVRGLGEALNNAGITFRRMGDNARALEYYLRAHKVYEEAGERRRLAGILNNIGIVHRALGDYGKALEYYEQALAIQQQAGNEEAVARLLSNMGVVYKRLGEEDRAIEHYLRSLEIKRKRGDRRGIAYTLNNLGAAYRDLGKSEAALENYRASLEIKEELGDRKGMARTFLNIARVHQDTGRLALAIEMLERSIALATDIGAKDELMESYEELSESYAEAGRFEEALEAFETYERIKDELFNERNSEIIAEMQARYESEQKEKEIEVLEHQRLSVALELSRERSTRNVLLVFVALLGLVLVLLYARFRFKIQQRLLKAEELRKVERESYIEELEEKKAEVEARNAEMEQFTYTVSHDLKSPLFTIQGFLGYLEQDAVAGQVDKVRDDVRRIRSAAHTMSQQLDELLELSRIGRMMNEPEEVPMAEVAAEAVELLAGRIRENGVRVDVAPNLPSVCGDRPRLRQVLQNLIENGVRFMDDSSDPRVEVAARADGDETVFFVRDNGIGVEPEYHERIFGLFERLSQDKGGTGIGLALVRRIVEVHGGRVWIESEGAGQGSTFCFTVPRFTVPRFTVPRFTGPRLTGPRRSRRAGPAILVAP